MKQLVHNNKQKESVNKITILIKALNFIIPFLMFFLFSPKF